MLTLLKEVALRKVLCGSLLLIVLLAGNTAADTYIRQVTSTDPFEVAGRKMPGKADSSVIWLARDMATMTNGATGSVIVRVDRKTIYIINNSGKSYAEIPMEWYSEALKQSDSTSPDSNSQINSLKEMASKMIGSTKVTVSQTGKTKKIRTWKAEEYKVEISTAQGITTSEVWASSDVKLDLELYRTLTNAFLSQVPGFVAIMKEMRKVQGMAVYSVREMGAMGTKIRSTTELIECTEKPAPKGAFDLPSGFAKVKLEDLKMGR